jgi:hypothetical protein
MPVSAQPEVGQTPDEAAASTGYQASELRRSSPRKHEPRARCRHILLRFAEAQCD